MVTRNPCLHPGDVRRLVAVDTPALHHLVDCIVFPSVGPRPHPNEMSGMFAKSNQQRYFYSAVIHGTFLSERLIEVGC